MTMPQLSVEVAESSIFATADVLFSPCPLSTRQHILADMVFTVRALHEAYPVFRKRHYISSPTNRETRFTLRFLQR